VSSPDSTPHLSLDALADLLAGEGTDDDVAHVGGCAGCAGRLDELATAGAAVSATLSALPAPTMPAELAERLSAAFAAEPALQATPASAGPVALDDDGAGPATGAPGPVDGQRHGHALPGRRTATARLAAGRRRRRAAGLRRRARHQPAAVRRRGQRRRGHQRSERRGRVGRGRRAVGLLPQRDRHRLRGHRRARRRAAPAARRPDHRAERAAVRRAACAGLGGPARDRRGPRAGAVPPPEHAGPAGVGARADPALDRLRTPEGLASCLTAVLPPEDPAVRPLAVDYAVYQAQPALVVVLPAAGTPDKVDVFVVGADCAVGNDATLFFTRLDRPS
jgi:hypothetical protein